MYTYFEIEQFKDFMQREMREKMQNKKNQRLRLNKN